MFDPKKLLDSFLGGQGLGGQGLGGAGGRGGTPGSGTNPWGDAPANSRPAGAAPQTGGFGGSGGGGFLGNIADTLSGPEGIKRGAGQVVDMARQNPLAAGAILAGLFGTGMGRGVAGSALKYGGLAAIASMAYKAYQAHQSGQTPTQAQQARPELLPPPADTGFDPAEAPQGETEFATALLRAMIAAARADGTIDADERKRIGDKAKLSGMGEEAERFLLDELMKPVDVDAIAAQATTEAQRIELYTASRLAISPDNAAERDHLARLASSLGLASPLVDHIEATVSAAQA